MCSNLVTKVPEVGHRGSGSCFKMAIDQERRAVGGIVLPGHKSGLDQPWLGRLGSTQ